MLAFMAYFGGERTIRMNQTQLQQLTEKYQGWLRIEARKPDSVLTADRSAVEKKAAAPATEAGR